LILGLAGVVTMPAAVVIAYRSPRVPMLDAVYGVPFAFVLGILAAGMARRAKRNLEWLALGESKTGVASIGVILGVLAVSLALTGALAVGFYEAIVYYQHHH
jgi:hypothetical protein